jgi:hypothetical protein
MTAQQNFDVLELEAKLLNRILNRGHIPLKNRIDQNVALRRGNEERRQAFRPNVVNVPNDLVRRDLLVLLFRVADVTREQILNSEDTRRLLREKKRR